MQRNVRHSGETGVATAMQRQEKLIAKCWRTLGRRQPPRHVQSHMPTAKAAARPLHTGRRDCRRPPQATQRVMQRHVVMPQLGALYLISGRGVWGLEGGARKGNRYGRGEGGRAGAELLRRRRMGPRHRTAPGGARRHPHARACGAGGRCTCR
eukprot:SM000141S00835  [mRNA]  locus=s141:74504:75066:+ [translate_table: standard]